MKLELERLKFKVLEWEMMFWGDIDNNTSNIIVQQGLLSEPASIGYIVLLHGHELHGDVGMDARDTVKVHPGGPRTGPILDCNRPRTRWTAGRDQA